MPCCVAIGCSNSDKKGYLMKHFPRDPIRKKLWMAKIKRDKWTPSQHSCICEYLKDVSNGNCDEDERELLSGFLDVIQKPKVCNNMSELAKKLGN
ncbi:hypothetical protein ACI65C_013685 [Semiaphis heraclei]